MTEKAKMANHMNIFYIINFCNKSPSRRNTLSILIDYNGRSS